MFGQGLEIRNGYYALKFEIDVNHIDFVKKIYDQLKLRPILCHFPAFGINEPFLEHDIHLVLFVAMILYSDEVSL